MNKSRISQAAFTLHEVQQAAAQKALEAEQRRQALQQLSENIRQRNLSKVVQAQDKVRVKRDSGVIADRASKRVCRPNPNPNSRSSSNPGTRHRSRISDIFSKSNANIHFNNAEAEEAIIPGKGLSDSTRTNGQKRILNSSENIPVQVKPLPGTIFTKDAKKAIRRISIRKSDATSKHVPGKDRHPDSEQLKKYMQNKKEQAARKRSQESKENAERQRQRITNVQRSEASHLNGAALSRKRSLLKKQRQLRSAPSHASEPSPSIPDPQIESALAATNILFPGKSATEITSIPCSPTILERTENDATEVIGSYETNIDQESEIPQNNVNSSLKLLQRVRKSAELLEYRIARFTSNHNDSLPVAKKTCDSNPNSNSTESDSNQQSSIDGATDAPFSSNPMEPLFPEATLQAGLCLQPSTPMQISEPEVLINLPSVIDVLSHHGAGAGCQIPVRSDSMQLCHLMDVVEVKQSNPQSICLSEGSQCDAISTHQNSSQDTTLTDENQEYLQYPSANPLSVLNIFTRRVLDHREQIADRTATFPRPTTPPMSRPSQLRSFSRSPKHGKRIQPSPLRPVVVELHNSVDHVTVTGHERFDSCESEATEDVRDVASDSDVSEPRQNDGIPSGPTTPPNTSPVPSSTADGQSKLNLLQTFQISPSSLERKLMSELDHLEAIDQARRDLQDLELSQEITHLTNTVRSTKSQLAAALNDVTLQTNHFTEQSALEQKLKIHKQECTEELQEILKRVPDSDTLRTIIRQSFNECDSFLKFPDAQIKSEKVILENSEDPTILSFAEANSNQSPVDVTSKQKPSSPTPSKNSSKPAFEETITIPVPSPCHVDAHQDTLAQPLISHKSRNNFEYEGCSESSDVYTDFSADFDKDFNTKAHENPTAREDIPIKSDASNTLRSSELSFERLPPMQQQTEITRFQTHLFRSDGRSIYSVDKHTSVDGERETAETLSSGLFTINNIGNTPSDHDAGKVAVDTQNRPVVDNSSRSEVSPSEDVDQLSVGSFEIDLGLNISPGTEPDWTPSTLSHVQQPIESESVTITSNHAVESISDLVVNDSDPDGDKFEDRVVPSKAHSEILSKEIGSRELSLDLCGQSKDECLSPENSTFYEIPDDVYSSTSFINEHEGSDSGEISIIIPESAKDSADEFNHSDVESFLADSNGVTEQPGNFDQLLSDSNSPTSFGLLPIQGQVTISLHGDRACTEAHPATDFPCTEETHGVTSTLQNNMSSADYESKHNVIDAAEIISPSDSMRECNSMHSVSAAESDSIPYQSDFDDPDRHFASDTTNIFHNGPGRALPNQSATLSTPSLDPELPNSIHRSDIMYDPDPVYAVSAVEFDSSPDPSNFDDSDLHFSMDITDISHESPSDALLVSDKTTAVNAPSSLDPVFQETSPQCNLTYECDPISVVSADESDSAPYRSDFYDADRHLSLNATDLSHKRPTEALAVPDGGTAVNGSSSRDQVFQETLPPSTLAYECDPISAISADDSDSAPYRSDFYDADRHLSFDATDLSYERHFEASAIHDGATSVNGRALLDPVFQGTVPPSNLTNECDPISAVSADESGSAPYRSDFHDADCQLSLNATDLSHRNPSEACPVSGDAVTVNVPSLLDPVFQEPVPPSNLTYEFDPMSAVSADESDSVPYQTDFHDVDRQLSLNATDLSHESHTETFAVSDGATAVNVPSLLGSVSQETVPPHLTYECDPTCAGSPDESDSAPYQTDFYDADRQGSLKVTELFDEAPSETLPVIDEAAAVNVPLLDPVSQTSILFNASDTITTLSPGVVSTEDTEEIIDEIRESSNSEDESYLFDLLAPHDDVLHVPVKSSYGSNVVEGGLPVSSVEPDPIADPKVVPHGASMVVDTILDSNCVAESIYAHECNFHESATSLSKDITATQSIFSEESMVSCNFPNNRGSSQDCDTTNSVAASVHPGCVYGEIKAGVCSTCDVGDASPDENYSVVSSHLIDQGLSLTDRGLSSPVFITSESADCPQFVAEPHVGTGDFESADNHVDDVKTAEFHHNRLDPEVFEDVKKIETEFHDSIRLTNAEPALTLSTNILSGVSESVLTAPPHPDDEASPGLPLENHLLFEVLDEVSVADALSRQIWSSISQSISELDYSGVIPAVLNNECHFDSNFQDARKEKAMQQMKLLMDDPSATLLDQDDLDLDALAECVKSECWTSAQEIGNDSPNLARIAIAQSPIAITRYLSVVMEVIGPVDWQAPLILDLKTYQRIEKNFFPDASAAESEFREFVYDIFGEVLQKNRHQIEPPPQYCHINRRRRLLDHFWSPPTLQALIDDVMKIVNSEETVDNQNDALEAMIAADVRSEEWNFDEEVSDIMLETADRIFTEQIKQCIL